MLLKGGVERNTHFLRCSGVTFRLGRAETLKYSGAPCLREIRPPSTFEDSRHCQLTVQSDGENSRARNDAGGSQGSSTTAGKLGTLKRCLSWRIIGPQG